jgi:hypothetical protein
MCSHPSGTSSSTEAPSCFKLCACAPTTHQHANIIAINLKLFIFFVFLVPGKTPERRSHQLSPQSYTFFLIHQTSARLLFIRPAYLAITKTKPKRIVFW